MLWLLKLQYLNTQFVAIILRIKGNLRMKSQQGPNRAMNRFDEGNLIFMLGEELKKPLTAIKALAENNSGKTAISLEARKALRTIDNVLLYQQLSSDQLALELTPVHIGNTLTKVATDLEPLSIERGCETEIYIQSGISAVDVNMQVLQSGLESLWQAVLGMTERPSPLNWHVYRAGNGIRVVVTNNSIDLSKVTLSSAQSSVGNSRQPMAGIAGPATDLLTARSMFELIGGNLSKMHKDGNSGLGITLPISPQLALV